MRILYVTTISLTINSFFKPHIEMLVRKGHQVDIACNDRQLALDPLYEELGCHVHRVDFSRSPFSSHNVKAYSQLKKVIKNGNYDIVHCHTPNAAAVTRLVCKRFRKKNGLKVFYTAHGFHFYKGAPKLNWLVYYPVEKICSRYTDKLITINQEDYALAKNKFKAKAVHYVPGVGIDLTKFENIQVDRNAKRDEIGVPEDALLLLSVGELNDNKNHQIFIKALAAINHPHVHYAIAGEGQKKAELLHLAETLGVAERVHFLGYRKDVSELYKAADIFCFPSFREGLSASLMEAMASRMPVICSKIRGNVDLIEEKGGSLFDPYQEHDCAEQLAGAVTSNLIEKGQFNFDKVKHFGIASVLAMMEDIYFGDF